MVRVESNHVRGASWQACPITTSIVEATEGRSKVILCFRVERPSYQTCRISFHNLARHPGFVACCSTFLLLHCRQSVWRCARLGLMTARPSSLAPLTEAMQSSPRLPSQNIRRWRLSLVGPATSVAPSVILRVRPFIRWVASSALADDDVALALA